MFDMKVTDCKEVSFIFIYENISELGKDAEYHGFGGFTAIFNGVERSFDWMDSSISNNQNGTYETTMYNLDDCFEDEWKDKGGFPLYEDMIGITEFTEFNYETAYPSHDIYEHAEPIRVLSAKFINEETGEEFDLPKSLIENINKLVEDDSHAYRQD